MTTPTQDVSEEVRENLRITDGQILMIFYIVLDVSWSMKDVMPELNEALRELYRAIQTEPDVDDVARICVVAFSDKAEVVVPLGQASAEVLPVLTAQSGTQFGAAFRLVGDRMQVDRRELRAQGYRVYRPCVFVLTDGEPNDRDWEQSFRATLVARPGEDRAYGIVVPYGFRDAPDDVVRRMAYPPDKSHWYTVHTASPAEAVKGILDVIMKTVLTNSLSAHQASGPLVGPQAPDPGSPVQQHDADPNLW